MMNSPIPPPPLDWESQRIFLAVIREGSLSAAARALQLAQPTVRRRLDALEKAVGSALFTRSPAGLHPTPVALELARHAETMAAAAEAFARAASAADDDRSGTVRISCSELMGVEVLPRLLAPLQAEHPGLVLELSPTNRVEDLLRHEADLAVRMAPLTQGAVVARKAAAIRLGLFAHRDYLARAGVPQDWADLPRFALVGPDRDTATLRAVSLGHTPLRRAMFSLRTDNQLAQLAAVRASMGIGICQLPLAAREPDLVPVLPALYSHTMDTWVAMHEDLRRVRRVGRVFRHLVQALEAYAAV